MRRRNSEKKNYEVGRYTDALTSSWVFDYTYSLERTICLCPAIDKHLDRFLFQKTRELENTMQNKVNSWI